VHPCCRRLLIGDELKLKAKSRSRKPRLWMPKFELDQLLFCSVVQVATILLFNLQSTRVPVGFSVTYVFKDIWNIGLLKYDISVVMHTAMQHA